MNEIDITFRRLRRKKEKAFIAYISAGDPKLSVTEELIFALKDAGVDLIELGIPFSDPMADGPTIQRASERSLKNKTNLTDIFRLLQKIRGRVGIPVVLMGYYNPIFRYGIKKFMNDAAQRGVSGVIVPDLPPEEADELIREAKKKGVATIFLLAPTSTPERIRLVAAKSTGFVYYVSLTGTTGERNSLPASLKGEVRRVRRLTDKPVCVGFGISTGRQAKKISEFADGVIVGSAIIKVIERNLKDKNLVKKVYNFVHNLSCEAKDEK